MLSQPYLFGQPPGITVSQQTLVAYVITMVKVVVVISTADVVLMLLTYPTFHLVNVSFCSSSLLHEHTTDPALVLQPQ